MVDLVRQQHRTGRAVAALLAADGLAHLYWATGLTWPAADERALSRAVLGSEVSFGPQVVLPLAVLLFTGAAAVWARSRGRGGRLATLVVFGVAAGLLVRGTAGLAWVCGADNGGGPVFFRLNLFLYTPVCLGFGWAAVRLLVRDRRGRANRGVRRGELLGDH
ncbi:DUF3995 domain-containing protein [Streptomyces sp. NPDC051211]|uniref:DUF3995 domain-containing protein n=1 Tax=Streptomyces sp. NPDC051211 TaxID=3154643 RepID=UPI00344D68C4